MSQSGPTLQTNSTETGNDSSGAEETTNIKETIESILVAFILAFIFRAFVVEAFVIPTGSMAPTLLGAHMRYRCPDCGYTFDVNYSPRDRRDEEDMRTPADGYPDADIYCPNCGYHIATPTQAAPVNYGDRILVLKYSYLLHPPRRWDVVVFKSPDQPETYHYQENYIKRLVGLPGERLMVMDGSIFVWKNGQWEVQHKTPSAQEALWRLVYDNDFHPHLAQRVPPEWVQPWRDSGSGWDLTSDDGGRIFKFDNPSGRATLRFDPNANSTTQTLTDYLVYDTAPKPGMLRRPGAISGSADDDIAFPVSDLKLEANYTRKSGDGAFQITLSKSEDVDHTFTLELTPQEARLIHRTNTGKITTTAKTLASLGIRADRPIFVQFQNVDYEVQVWLNGKSLLDKPLDYQPNIEWLMDQWRSRRRGKEGGAEIDAEEQSCTIEHLGLWRDVYYTNQHLEGGALLTATPDNPVQLGPREYFTMGDNSEVSEDARYWSEPIDLPHEGLDGVAYGRVPEQFLLGKAVFVYWPAGYRAYDHFAIIPNFGDMRWIR